EAKHILADYGIDAKESWRQLMARVAEHDEKKRIERRNARFALVREQVKGYEGQMARWKRREQELMQLPQPELVAMWSALQAKGANIQVFHRKLEAMTKEDLASLIAHYEDAESDDDKT